MKSNWLSSRLTKSKQASTMWVTLADTVQASFEGVLGGIVDTIVNNRSVMTMSVNEVKRKQESLGHFFSVLDVPDVEKGLTLLHRLDQIHLKSTEFPIKDMVRRNFDGLEMDWSPVYAPIDQVAHPYGTRLIAQTEFERLDDVVKEDWFMTSRGRMILNLNKYLPNEEELNNIYNTIFETIIPMIPLDIVFDGFFTQVKIAAVFDVHEYNQFTNPITDTLNVAYDIHHIAKNSEVLDSNFNVKDDFFSLDSVTRTERLPFDDRRQELLGEQPLGLLPLGALYTNDKYQVITDSMAGEPMLLGDSWKSSAGLLVPSGDSFIAGASSSFLYHKITCVVGERYIVTARKENNARARFIVSESNSAGGEVTQVFSKQDNVAQYGSTFQATSFTMYLVVLLDMNKETNISNIQVKKLTAI